MRNLITTSSEKQHHKACMRTKNNYLLWHTSLFEIADFLFSFSVYLEEMIS